MSSKKEPRTLHGNKTEPSCDLSRHYREIGIKAVAAASRKEHSRSNPSERHSDEKQKRAKGH
jgi:hypothetical protein